MGGEEWTGDGREEQVGELTGIEEGEDEGGGKGGQERFGGGGKTEGEIEKDDLEEEGGSEERDSKG